MPTTRTQSMNWRQRRFATNRKGAFETDMLFEDEDGFNMAPKPLTSKNAMPNLSSQPDSPVSVASALNVPVEVKPLMLPGSWVVVGKGGKPLKNDKMYDEPVSASKKKKKKKSRARTIAEPEPLVVTLEEAASSSKCLQAVERSTTRRNKLVARSQDAKHWAGYHRAKQLKRDALDELVAALSLVDDAGDEATLPAPPAPKATKDHKANSSKDKARRRARSAATSARCDLWDDDELHAGAPEDMTVSKSSAKKRSARTSGEPRLLGSASAMGDSPQVKLPGAWTTVGKRGKAVCDFPPLMPSDKKPEPPKPAEPQKAADNKRKSSEQLPQKAVDNKRGKSMKCLVM